TTAARRLTNPSPAAERLGSISTQARVASSGASTRAWLALLLGTEQAPNTLRSKEGALRAQGTRFKERVMGLFTKDIKTMDDLLLHGLQDIYYAENHIVKSLPKLIEQATNRDLNKGLRDHLEETKNQI